MKRTKHSKLYTTSLYPSLCDLCKIRQLANTYCSLSSSAVDLRDKTEFFSWFMLVIGHKVFLESHEFTLSLTHRKLPDDIIYYCLLGSQKYQLSHRLVAKS